jgi:uncharacterized protein
MATNVVDDTEHNRFELYVDEERAGEIDYIISGNDIHLTHTFVYPDRREHGLAASFVSTVLGIVRSTSYRLVPDCPYVAHWLTENHEFDDLLTR